MVILYSKMILSVILVIALIIVIAPLITIFVVPGRLAKVEKHVVSKLALAGKHIKQEIQRTFPNRSMLSILKIFPGTKWCGDGDIAQNYDDLGVFRQEDACCRAHDHCDDYIEAGKTKHGLTNYALTTFSACHCDTAFYNCLQNASSIPAKSLGFALFTIWGAQCFKVEHPVIRCAKMDSRTIRGYEFTRCGQYLLNKTAPKVYQWFDNPLF